MGFRHLLLGLCLYMVALDVSFVHAKMIEMIEDNGQEETVVTKELSKDAAMVGAVGSRKWLRGIRKMQLGAEGALEKKKVDVVQVKGPVEETGKANVHSEKSIRTATLHNKQDSTGITVTSKPTITVSKNGNKRTELGVRKRAHDGLHDPLQRTLSRKPVDAVTEVYNMLNKDYQIKARRRPPINNATPLH